MIKTITITKDVAQRSGNTATSCPVATAIKDVCPASEPHVYGREVVFCMGDGVDHHEKMIYSPDVSKVVRWWDFNRYSDDEPIITLPFSFDLDIPDEVLCD